MTNIKTLRQEFTEFFKSLKPSIGSDTLIETGDGPKPGLEITIGYDLSDGEIAWNYQTGDNSYTGGAYSFRHWAVVTLMRRSNCADLAKEVCDEICNTLCNTLPQAKG